MLSHGKWGCFCWQRQPSWFRPVLPLDIGNGMHTHLPLCTYTRECTNMKPFRMPERQGKFTKPWMPESQRVDTNICKVWLWWRAKGSGSFQGHSRASTEEAFRVDQGEEVCELLWLLVWVLKGQILEGRVMWEEPDSGREHDSSLTCLYSWTCVQVTSGCSFL